MKLSSVNKEDYITPSLEVFYCCFESGILYGSPKPGQSEDVIDNPNPVF